MSMAAAVEIAALQVLGVEVRARPVPVSATTEPTVTWSFDGLVRTTTTDQFSFSPLRRRKMWGGMQKS